MGARFNEAYTLYLNTEGKPVQRTLAEMTRGEVLQAIDWHTEEAVQAERDAEPFETVVAALDAGTSNLDDTPPALLRAAGQAVVRVGQTHDRLSRLLGQVSAVLAPYEQRHPGMGAAELARRYWPR